MLSSFLIGLMSEIFISKSTTESVCQLFCQSYFILTWYERICVRSMKREAEKDKLNAELEKGRDLGLQWGYFLEKEAN